MQQQDPWPGIQAASLHAPVYMTPEAAAWRDESRLRVLRGSAFSGYLLGDDHFARFWFRDLRRLCLFLTLMLKSAWLREGQWGRFAMAELAQQSRMSVARVYQVLNLGKATGDFSYRRDPRDARMILLEPSPTACQALETLVAHFSAALSAFLGRPDPLPQLTPEQRREAYMAFAETVLALLVRVELEDRRTGSTTFLLALLDLWLHSPVVPADFVRREAIRLRVTQVTMRSVLHRAEEVGLIERYGRMIGPTETAQQRIAAAVGDTLSSFSALLAQMEARLHLLEAHSGHSTPTHLVHGPVVLPQPMLPEGVPT